MSVYKRGGTLWHKFRFDNQVARESARTASKTIAKEAERAGRRQLDTSVNGVVKRERSPLFSVASRNGSSQRPRLHRSGVGIIASISAN
jgi:hypothetical protein